MRSKIITQSTILAKVNDNRGCNISCQKNADIERKLTKSKLITQYKES
jgi:hypothetical protein